MSTAASHRIVHRTCPLCEATCGIAVEVEGDRVVTIRGDQDDSFSQGYLCPKAYGLKALHEDPDRLRQPMRRTKSGWQPISWEQAFDEAIERLSAIKATHGADALATYVGNPAAHNYQILFYGPVLARALGSRQRYSASSADQLPKMVSAALMFGGSLTIPVPDVDRTDYLLVLGGNPLVSNGSLMTAPDMRRRLDAIRARGGKVVVIDPRRTETAQRASEHHFIRPGTDALLLLAMVHVMFAEGLVELGRLAGHVRNLDQVEAAARDFTPELASQHTGIEAQTIRRLTRELCAADRAACYGRIGTTCQAFGTVASWAVDLVNILSGNLDRPGGAMFAKPAASLGASKRGRSEGERLGRWHSRVKKLPESFGELPVSALADEILTGDGDSRVRGLITMAGNPLLSAPNSDRLTRAFESLEFMVSIDLYRNETTRLAHLILPPPSPLMKDSYELALYHFAVRNVARYSPAVFDRPADQPDEWQILLTLAKGIMGQKAVPLNMADDLVASQVATMALDSGPWSGVTMQDALAAVGQRRGPARLLDLMLRLGAHGDGLGRAPGGVSLDQLQASPHGLDLGPLGERVPEVLTTSDGRIDLAPALIMADLDRLRAFAAREPAAMVLIGRRHLRSNNSWMHNLPPLAKGPERCTLLMSPADASRLGLATGSQARITSRVGSVIAPVEVTDEMMPGVISLPHGWGHTAEGVSLRVAAAHPGVNVNVLSDDEAVDVPTGNAAFNGVPVTVEPVA